MTHRQLTSLLAKNYPPGEARAVASWLMEAAFGLTTTDIVMGRDALLGSDDCLLMEQMAARLLTGEPVQYVVGKAFFGDMTLSVRPGVLIPRPETAELCRWVDSCWGEESRPRRAVDICTGSGCIALWMKKHHPGAAVEAWDIMETPLTVTRENAREARLDIAVRRQDALRLPDDRAEWDVIVSNPPYVRLSERATMAHHVVDFEPHEALFVDDSEATVFYHSIGHYALGALKKGGTLFFELNDTTAHSVADELAAMGFGNVELRQDQFGRTRFLRATLSNSTP